MRVWINPDKMAKLGLTATDVSRAIQTQNRQNPAGCDWASRRRRTAPIISIRSTLRAGCSNPSSSGDIIVRARAGRVTAPAARHRARRARRAGLQDLQPHRRKPAALMLPFI